jgi:hypothetical protein
MTKHEEYVKLLSGKFVHGVNNSDNMLIVLKGV